MPRHFSAEMFKCRNVNGGSAMGFRGDIPERNGKNDLLLFFECI